jgi:hypothetical protein
VKTFVDANISISPLTGSQQAGTATDRTMTITVYTDDGSGVGPVLTGGVPVTASLTDSGGASSSFDPTNANGCTTSSVTDATLGTCTVQINSSSAGHTVIHASFSGVNVGGVSLSRATGDTNTGDSADAYVDWFTLGP